MKTEKVIAELLDENLIGAKREITDILYTKMAEKLTDVYEEIAPSILGEKKNHDKDGDGDEDSEDWEMARDSAIKKKNDEDEDEDEDDKTVKEEASCSKTKKSKKSKKEEDESTSRPAGTEGYWWN